MAEMVVKEIFFKIASSQRDDEAVNFIKSNPVFVINEVVKRVKELGQFRGNLVVVRINPAFFPGCPG